MIAVKRPTTNIKQAASLSAASSTATASTAAAYAASTDAYLRSSSGTATDAYDPAYAAYAVGDPDYAAYADAWTLLRADSLALEQGIDLRTLPLWPAGMSADMVEAWTKGRAWMEDAPGHAFWIRWYEAILEGKPLTQDWDSHWQLMQDIALIPNEDWGEGKEQDAIRVAGLIDLITQKHALQQEVARAKRALENEVFNAMTLGQHRDNLPDDMPPSRIVEYRTALKELQIELDAVEETLQPPVPDAEVLEQATGRLRAVWEKIKKYPAAAVFVTLIGAAATGAATTAGSRGMDWLLDHGMPQLIRGLKGVEPKPSAPPKASKGWEKHSVDT